MASEPKILLRDIETVEGLSSLTGHAPRTVRRLARLGILPGVKIGSRWLFERGALLEALRPPVAASGRGWPPDGLDEAGRPYFGGGK